MSGRVTIQDIADALGVSRNTVSKAINNTGILADSTREKVLKKAVEMGYKQFSYIRFDHDGGPAAGQGAFPGAGLSLPEQTVLSAAESPRAFSDTAPAPAEDVLSPSGRAGMIAMLSPQFLGSSHFSTEMLGNFESELARLSYGFAMYRVSRQNLEQRILPASIRRETVDGIICFEMFDPAYCEMLCGLGIPVLFVDCPSPRRYMIHNADLLLTENRTGIFQLIKEMARRGKKKIGFLGESDHCLSFYERYMAFRESMLTLGIPLREKYCLTGNRSVPLPSSDDYREYLRENLQNMKELPDLFICANDFVAIDALHVLKNLGISVPDDVYLCGFDDSPESRVITPTLSTVHIHSEIMGKSAVYLLVSRIRNPSLDHRVLYTETTLVRRASTGA